VKKSLSLLSAVAALTISSLPAMADTNDCVKNTLMLPVKAASIGVGAVVGIPVAITRRSADRCYEFTNNFADKIGGKENLPPRAFGMVLGVPFGMLVGTGEGVLDGGRNAVHYSCEKPFGLDSMSLGDDVHNDGTK
jgi:hypothetical protein